MSGQYRKEIWKDVMGFEGFYQVSNFGNVKSISHYTRNNVNGGKRLTTGKKLSQYRMPNGYLQVQLSKNEARKKCYVHRLVAIAFLENTAGLSDVNHKDGNKDNNNVENLEWCSHKENQVHMVKNRLTKKAKPVMQLETGVIYNSIMEAQRNTGIERHSIKESCVNGKSYKGTSWRLV